MSDPLVLNPKNLLNLVLFGVLSIAIFLPSNYLILSGLLIYLWLFPLVEVPVLVFQMVSAIAASSFSIGLAWISTEIVRKQAWHFDNEHISLGGHLLRLGLFIIALLDSALYFWNIIGMISALLLFWFGKKKTWRILGIVAWTWTLLVQIYIILSLGV